MRKGEWRTLEDFRQQITDSIPLSFSWSCLWMRVCMAYQDCKGNNFLQFFIQRSRCTWKKGNYKLRILKFNAFLKPIRDFRSLQILIQKGYSRYCREKIKLNHLNWYLISTEFSVTISFHHPLTQMKVSEQERHKGWIKYFVAIPHLKIKIHCLHEWEWFFSAMKFVST